MRICTLSNTGSPITSRGRDLNILDLFIIVRQLKAEGREIKMRVS